MVLHSFPLLFTRRRLPTPADWVADMREAVALDQSARYAEAQVIYDRIQPVIKGRRAFRRPTFSARNSAMTWPRTTIISRAMPTPSRSTSEAIAIWRQATGLPARRDLALCLGNLAALNRAMGRFPAAETFYREELQLLERVSGKRIGQLCDRVEQPRGTAAVGRGSTPERRRSPASLWRRRKGIRFARRELGASPCIRWRSS